MTRRAITILSLLTALGATTIGAGTAAAKHGADDGARAAHHAHKHRVHHHHARGRDDRR